MSVVSSTCGPASSEGERVESSGKSSIVPRPGVTRNTATFAVRDSVTLTWSGRRSLGVAVTVGASD